MEKVKLSTLPKDTVVLADGEHYTTSVENILEDLDNYRYEDIYTTTEFHASFNAKEIMDMAIEDVSVNGMYEDWDDSINADVTNEDIEDLQKIFDRILARNPSSNIAYNSDKLIEIDM